MIAKVEAEFDKARSRHAAAVETLARRRDELDKDEAREEERWETEQRRHKDALKGLRERLEQFLRRRAPNFGRRCSGG